MKKKLLSICSVVLIFAVLFSACGSEMGGLSQEEQAKMQEAYQKRFGISDVGEYYGTYNGCVVTFAQGEIMAVGECYREAAGYIFGYTSAFVIGVYKDGTAYLMEEAYDEGLLTAENIKEIYERHIKEKGDMHIPDDPYIQTYNKQGE